MLFRQITDVALLTPSGSLSALSATQTITARIKQEARRLEGIIINLTMTTGASAAGSGDGFAGMIKEVRLRVNDVLGDRNAVRIWGPAAVGYARNNFGFTDRNTFRSCSSSQIASLAQSCNLFIPLRHLAIAEPYGNVTSLPLSSNFLKSDPLLEIDIHPAATVFSAGAPSTATVKVLLLLREVPESVPYIPSELITDTFNGASSSQKLSYDFANVGFLNQFLVQGYNNTAYGNAVARASVLASGGTYYLEYGRQILRKYDDDFGVAINDLTQFQANAVASDNLTNRAYPGEIFFDFLSDYPGQDAFSAGSMINLNTDALGGDKCRFIVDQFLYSSNAYMAKVTYHKFLARTREALDALKVAI